MAVRKGKGTKIRFLALDEGVTARPADNALILITGMQTSEIKGGQEMDTAPTGDYETTDDNLWRDNDTVKSLNWTFSVSGHVTDSAAQTTAIQALWDAWMAGKTIWIERLRPGDVKWKGGRAKIQDPTEPDQWDGELGFSASFMGQGAIIETAVTP